MNPAQATNRESAVDYRTRIRLALSILNERPTCELTCELAVMALRGATVGELAAYAAAY